jgi:hypothetical protein
VLFRSGGSGELAGNAAPVRDFRNGAATLKRSRDCQGAVDIVQPISGVFDTTAPSRSRLRSGWSRLRFQMAAARR